MFKAPHNGTTEIYIGERYIGRADNQKNVPVRILDTLLSYILAEHERVANPPFAVSFTDGEKRFGLVEFAGSLYVVNNDGKDSNKLIGERIDPELLGLDKNAEVKEMIYALAEECVQDMKENFQEWVVFQVPKGSNQETPSVLQTKNRISGNMFALTEILKVWKADT